MEAQHQQNGSAEGGVKNRLFTGWQQRQAGSQRGPAAALVQLEGAADNRSGRRRQPLDDLRRPGLAPLAAAGDGLPRAALRLAVLLVRHATLVPAAWTAAQERLRKDSQSLPTYRKRRYLRGRSVAFHGTTPCVVASDTIST